MGFAFIIRSVCLPIVGLITFSLLDPFGLDCSGDFEVDFPFDFDLLILDEYGFEKLI